MAVAMQYGNRGSSNGNSTQGVIYEGLINDGNTLTFELDAGKMYEIFTAEYNASTDAYRGHRARLVKMPEASLYGTVAAATVNEAASSNSGVTITMNADSTISIKRSSATYAVKYVVRAVDVSTGSAISINGGSGSGTGTLSQVTFNGVEYYDDGNGNVTFDESDPAFTASVAHSITSTDVTNWNAKQDVVSAGNGIDITTNVISNTQGIEYIVGTQAAATNAWTGVSTDSSLKTGKIIAYYLPYAGNSSAATLQLTMADGTTTAAIALRRTSSSTVTTHFAAGNVIILIYDGTYWKVSAYYDANSNTIPTGYCTTAAATAAKSATCTYGYRDDANYFPCLFRYANTASNATLAIATYATTALPIYVNGARTSSSNTFGAGVILFLYYNSAYYCYNDGRLPIVVNGVVTSVQDQFALYTPTSSLATVATSGDYSDLSNTPVLATVATSGSYSDLSNTPSLATVATSGDYTDLSNTPSLATVATSGDYSDLSNTPALATVATSGSYNDLSDTPSIHNVPSGGSTGQVLAKSSATDYDVEWVNQSGGGGGSGTLTQITFNNAVYPDDGTGNVTLNEADPVFTTSVANTITSTDITNWDTKAPAIQNTASGSVVNFPDGSGYPFDSVVAEIEPVQDLSNGDPSPTNICPITGWTGLTVNRTGTNLVGQDTLLLGTSWVKSPESLPTFAGQPVYYGTLSNLCGSGKTLANKIPVTFNYEENTRYRVCWWWRRETPSTAGGLKAEFHYTDGTTSLSSNNSNNTTDFVRYGFASTAGKTISKISLTYNSSSAVYIAGFAIEKYDGTESELTAVVGNELQTITVPLGNTYYGGSLNATSGLLTVTDGYIGSYNGETLPSTWISDRDVYAQGTTPTTGAEVVYKLGTPQTYQLTGQEITTLLGRNTIWANTGDVSVIYRADTKIYISEDQKRQNENLAYVETSSTASRAYSVGDFFVNKDGILCEITASVSSGGTLVESTNYTVIGGNGGLASLFNVEVDNDPCNTLSSPFTSPLFSLVLIRCGKIRILTGDLSASSSTSSGATITTLKNAKDFPITDVLATTGNGGTNSLGLRITPSGEIKTYGSASSSRTYQAFSIIYCV